VKPGAQEHVEDVVDVLEETQVPCVEHGGEQDAVVNFR
jgi:hypothetical protein